MAPLVPGMGQNDVIPTQNRCRQPRYNYVVITRILPAPPVLGCLFGVMFSPTEPLQIAPPNPAIDRLAS